MDLRSQVQILDEAICISLHTNDCGKGMNPFFRVNYVLKFDIELVLVFFFLTHLTKHAINNQRMLYWVWILKSKHKLNIFIHVQGQYWSADFQSGLPTWKKILVLLFSKLNLIQVKSAIRVTWGWIFRLYFPNAGIIREREEFGLIGQIVRLLCCFKFSS